MLLTGFADIDLAIKNELASSTTLESSHQVVAEWNYNAYTKIDSIGCSYYSGSVWHDDPHEGKQSYYYSDDLYEADTLREIYTPLKSIFEINRPDPGIVHGVYSTIGKTNYLNGDSTNHSMELSRVFNMTKDHARFYPISKNSNYKYWNSYRRVNKQDIGISSNTLASGGYAINYAAPYIKYSSEIYVNKITIKIQKHLGYAKKWAVQVYKDGTWITIYNQNSDANTSMQEGILNLYYSSGQWNIYERKIENPNEKMVTDFSKTHSETMLISGVRFLVTAMSAPRIPLEVIEISPRLIADITNNVTSFDVSSSLSSSVYGLPVGSVISSSGSVNLTNYDGYFSKNNTDSILNNILKPNVEIKLYQKLVVSSTTYRFPLKTLYTGLWDETSDFSVQIRLEDYFKFFKEQTAPDLMIANKSGVPSSVSMLVFLDNVGFNNFRFEKTNNDYTGDKEDVVLDYFYSKKEQTVMEILESLAVSTQTAIYMDVDNELVAMTKEKMIAKKKVKDFWMVGNESTKQPSYYDGVSDTIVTYISNISSFDEALEPPITDVNVQYTGIGIEKKSMALVSTNTAKGDMNQVQETLERPDFGASIVNKDLKYTSDILWQAGNDKQTSDNYLAAAALVRDLSITKPYDKLKSIKVKASDEYDAIRSYYFDHNGKTHMPIYLDESMINTFVNTMSGYILINSEVIRYEGILYSIDDPLKKTFDSKIFFNKDEYNYAKSKLSQGGSIFPVALITHLDLLDFESSTNSTNKTFSVIGDGRGTNGTKVVAHKAINTKKDFLSAHTDWKKHGVNLWGTKRSLPSVISNGLTVSDRVETYLANQTMNFNSLIQTFPGHIRLSGPKGGKSLRATRTCNQATKDMIPIANASEQLVTGIFKDVSTKNASGKTVGVDIHKISTRMRLVSDVPKNVNPGEQTITNGNIAGLAWNVRFSKSGGSTGMTGYFLEFEDVGTIDGKSLFAGNYRNMRLYRVELNGNNVYQPVLLGNAWVNVSSTPNVATDMQEQLQSAQGNGKIYAQIFDVEVVIRSNSGTRQFDIYWEDQMVGSFHEPFADMLPKSSRIGLFVRGSSSAIFEYISSSTSPDEIKPKKSESVISLKSKSYLKSLGKKGFLPSGVSRQLDQNAKPAILFFEDFGRYAREVKKYDVRYSNPALSPRLITLAGINENYYVSSFTSNNHGASFWLYNTSNGPIQIDETAQTPLYISGFALKDIDSGTLQSSKILEKEDFDRILNDKYNENRKLYGKQELMISGEYINNYKQAMSLLKWTINNLSKERKTITLSIFPNPILKLGDKVGVLYSDKYYNNSKITYTITSISHSISNTGPDMTIELKECV